MHVHDIERITVGEDLERVMDSIHVLFGRVEVFTHGELVGERITG